MTTDGIICGRCPDVYPADQISAFDGDERICTLQDLRRQGAPTRKRSKGRRRTRMIFGLPDEPDVPLTPDVDVMDALKAYTFKCPEQHVVHGNPGMQFPIAVLGGSGASKSHVLPAIIRELDHKLALNRLGVTLEDGLYENPELSQALVSVFSNGEVLPPTQRSAMRGPWGYQLSVEGARDDLDYTLLLFDVAGEDLRTVDAISKEARFIALARALVVLIDPQQLLSTEFDEIESAEARRGNQLDVAVGIRKAFRVVAQVLTRVWQVRSTRDLPIPICFVIAKADAVDWPSDYDWSMQTDDVIEAVCEDGADLGGSLLRSSDATREALRASGGDLVIAEIERMFNPDWVRYAAASATSTMPMAGGERRWKEQPDPNGIALSILHVLALAGIVQEQAPNATDRE